MFQIRRMESPAYILVVYTMENAHTAADMSGTCMFSVVSFLPYVLDFFAWISNYIFAHFCLLPHSEELRYFFVSKWVDNTHPPIHPHTRTHEHIHVHVVIYVYMYIYIYIYINIYCSSRIFSARFNLSLLAKLLDALN